MGLRLWAHHVVGVSYCCLNPTHTHIHTHTPLHIHTYPCTYTNTYHTHTKHTCIHKRNTHVHTSHLHTHTLTTHTHTHTHRIDRAVSHVYRLALQDFTNPHLTSSCAAFIEMVDRDSTLLRVDVQAALRIARHGQQQQGEGNAPCPGRTLWLT